MEKERTRRVGGEDETENNGQCMRAHASVKARAGGREHERVQSEHAPVRVHSEDMQLKKEQYCI